MPYNSDYLLKICPGLCGYSVINHQPMCYEVSCYQLTLHLCVIHFLVIPTCWVPWDLLSVFQMQHSLSNPHSGREKVHSAVEFCIWKKCIHSFVPSPPSSYWCWELCKGLELGVKDGGQKTWSWGIPTLIEGEEMRLQFVLIENIPSKRRTMTWVQRRGNHFCWGWVGDVIREDFLEVVAWKLCLEAWIGLWCVEAVKIWETHWVTMIGSVWLVRLLRGFTPWKITDVGVGAWAAGMG